MLRRYKYQACEHEHDQTEVLDTRSKQSKNKSKQIGSIGQLHSTDKRKEKKEEQVDGGV